MSETRSEINTKVEAKIKISVLQKPGTFLFEGCIRYYAKKIIRGVLRIQRGPDVVLRSLVRGLRLVNAEFNINPSTRNMHRIVHVTSNPIALAWAIEQKKLGHIDKLIAGPNISILPTDDKAVLLGPSIDIILLPSEWTRDAFVQCSPTLEQKIKIWPSGVEIPNETSGTDATSTQGQTFIVFKKEFSDEKFETIKSKLNSSNVKYTVLEYGKFKQQTYFKLLESASGMIYLQKAESQGVALQEAWARNVPTLVWDSKTYTYGNNSDSSSVSDASNITVSGKVSAPYLTEQSGLFFDSVEDFDGKFKEFSDRIKNGRFSARAYCIEKLSDKASVDMYLDYISKI